MSDIHHVAIVSVPKAHPRRSKGQLLGCKCESIVGLWTTRYHADDYDVRHAPPYCWTYRVVNQWYATRHVVAHGANNCMGELISPHDQNMLSGYSTRLDLIADSRHNLSWTYKTVY